ncbi:MAG: DUF3795 domain-containing protein [Methanoregulaceae archaeon]|nr:DUF3795 domain-containing protein [Methanolinea sp.]MCC7567388.1 DUF3795 domain-containing protein [Methanoregulaceae archaeon]
MNTRIGVCGIACEVCPRMTRGECPNGETGCVPRNSPVCAIADCAFRRGVRTCFSCSGFPCELTGKGPVSPGFCRYIAGKDPGG